LRRLGDRFDAIVCASDDVRQRLTNGGIANCFTVPMGIDEGVFSPARRDEALRAKLLRLCGLDEHAHLLIGVGRLSAEKRWPLVIDAALAASNDLPLGLLLFGEGRERHRLERQIGANPHIHLMGQVRDRAMFAAIMASADALVHGCEAETFCMAAAEARASGIPIIVPDRGGAADHARHGAGHHYRAGSALAASQAIVESLRSRTAVPDPDVLTMQQHFTDLFALYRNISEARRVAA
jgi:alpha-1,6-mannosyltransferase